MQKKTRPTHATAGDDPDTKRRNCKTFLVSYTVALSKRTGFRILGDMSVQRMVISTSMTMEATPMMAVLKDKYATCAM